jgi:hypothetical protein
MRAAKLTGSSVHCTSRLLTVPTRTVHWIHPVRSNRSASYASLKKWPEALADAEKCVELKPDFIKVRPALSRSIPLAVLRCRAPSPLLRAVPHVAASRTHRQEGVRGELWCHWTIFEPPCVPLSSRDTLAKRLLCTVASVSLLPSMSTRRPPHWSPPTAHTASLRANSPTCA